MGASVPELVQYLDGLLGPTRFHDSSLNGVQVEGTTRIECLATAASASLASIDQAIGSGAQALLVHHGLLWGQNLRITGPFGRRLRALLVADCSLIGYHLPLDAHPQWGNNALICRGLGLAELAEFGDYKGVPISFRGLLPAPLSPASLIGRLEALFGHPVLHCPGGSDQIRSVGVVSGGGARWLAEAAAAGCDAFVTGEAQESSWHDAAEWRCHLLACGHHATECLAVHELGRHLADRFGVQHLPVTEINPL